MMCDNVTLSSISIGNRGSYGIAASAVNFSENLYTYLRITDITDDGRLDRSVLKSVDDKRAHLYLLKPNDIVFARTGASTGRNYFYDGSDGELVYAGFLIKFSLDPAKVNPRYIKYYCMSSQYKNWIRAFSTGSTRGNINAQTFGNMPILLPNRSQQDSIVSILKPLDDKIELNKRINANLEQQAQAIFKNWFINSDYRLGTVSEIIEYHDSKRIPLSSCERSKLTKIYPYYGATSVMDYVDRYIFDGVYLLLGEDGTVTDSRGFPVLQYVDGKFWVNNHAHVITGKNGFSVELLYILFSLTNVQSTVTGAVQPKISQASLNNVSVVIPPKSELQKLDSIIQPFFAMIRNLKRENKTLAQIRDSLLPKLISGEIEL